MHYLCGVTYCFVTFCSGDTASAYTLHAGIAYDIILRQKLPTYVCLTNWSDQLRATDQVLFM